jgi:hypothetical protein
MKCAPASEVRSSRWRVIVKPRHVLYPPPAWVSAAVYRPFDRNCVCGLVVCGDRKRRDAYTDVDGIPVALSAGRGSDRIASRGTRSCSSSSLACTRGSA